MIDNFFMNSSKLIVIIVFSLASTVWGQAQNSRPNVVLILADDVGFSDIGCYGSEINTPNLDHLAQQGVRFRNFYNMAKCNPSRSSLFTGLYLGNKRSSNSMPEVMKAAGYTTIMCGKAHFDKWVPERCDAPHFDYSFWFHVIDDHFVPLSGEYDNPFHIGKREINVTEIRKVATQEPLYKDDFVTDYALQYLDTAVSQGKPFFLYLPYNLAHYPLQARPKEIAKYRGKYLVGWDTIRQRRYERMKELGIIGKDWALSPPSSNINKFRKHADDYLERRKLIPLYRSWNTVSDREKDELDLEMAVFAAMVDRLDQNIGRVLKKLKDLGVSKNTIILFLSDNGSCPYDSNRDFSIPPGPAGSYRTLCAAWANVGNTPFRYYKQYGHEGGSHTHFIAWWPGHFPSGKILTQQGDIVDLLPTLLDISRGRYPKTVDGVKSALLDGESLLPIINGEKRKKNFFVAGVEPFRMLRSDNWKIVRVNNEPWQLYDISDDPTELHDLAKVHPETVKRLSTQYQDYKRETLVK